MTEWVYVVPVMGLSILLTAGGFGMINPSIASLISRSAGEGHVGLTMGVSQSMSALGRVVGPVWGGLLFEQAGITSPRSEEHTSELQSLMRTSYAVFCLKKKKKR